LFGCAIASKATEKLTASEGEFATPNQMLEVSYQR
jgi:hypothetical protein